MVFDEDCSEDLMTTGRSIALEYTIEVQGTVRLRGDGAKNAKMATGDIEVVPEGYNLIENKTTSICNRF